MKEIEIKFTEKEINILIDSMNTQESKILNKIACSTGFDKTCDLIDQRQDTAILKMKVKGYKTLLQAANPKPL